MGKKEKKKIKREKPLEICIMCLIIRSSVVSQAVKYLPTVQETCVQSLAWEDPLERGLASHSSILAKRIPWKEELAVQR